MGIVVKCQNRLELFLSMGLGKQILLGFLVIYTEDTHRQTYS